MAETGYAILRLKDLSVAALEIQDKLITAYARGAPELESLCKELNDNIASLLLFKRKIEALTPSAPVAHVPGGEPLPSA